MRNHHDESLRGTLVTVGRTRTVVEYHSQRSRHRLANIEVRCVGDQEDSTVKFSLYMRYYWYQDAM
jgi:hypothetical protein